MTVVGGALDAPTLQNNGAGDAAAAGTVVPAGTIVGQTTDQAVIGLVSEEGVSAGLRVGQASR
jgi:hypothetical protein